ncbi:MAG: hypothetical protein JWR10_4875 [Rubritepida sp.]|nr:hypothetical protein [Rubritepida sp.]
MNMLAKATEITRPLLDSKVLSSGTRSLGVPGRLARGLGWFGIALGVLELVGSKRLARALGMRGYEGLIRGYGVREIASGVVTLSVNPAAGIISRVAGDGLDILTLLAAPQQGNAKRGNVRLALLAVVGVTVLDVICQKALADRHARSRGPVRDYSDRSGFPNGLSGAGAVARTGS